MEEPGMLVGSVAEILVMNRRQLKATICAEWVKFSRQILVWLMCVFKSRLDVLIIPIPFTKNLLTTIMPFNN
jgi:hypothetical protein